MTAVRLVRSAALAHAEYADAAVVAPGAELIVLAGVCPLDEHGRTVAAGDVAGQTRQALRNLDTVLADCGASLADIVAVRLLVATDQRDDLRTAWAQFRAHVGDLEPPATLTGVTVLGYDDQLVELEVIVARAPR